MKRSHLALLLPILAIILLGLHCKPEPPDITPCFTVVADTFRDPREPVAFVNCSEGADSYFWQFGDGTTSTEASPAHTFAQVGTYDVRLTASLGDAQEIFIRRIQLAYPKIVRIRIQEVPKLNPWNNRPLDPDGSGLDLKLVLARAGEPITWASPIMENVALPYDFDLGLGLNLEAQWWTIVLEGHGYSNADTILINTRTLDQLLDAPIVATGSDSCRVQIFMAGVPL
jgi:hypothetical protein